MKTYNDIRIAKKSDWYSFSELKPNVAFYDVEYSAVSQNCVGIVVESASGPPQVQGAEDP